jgi:hypothetical protein
MNTYNWEFPTLDAYPTHETVQKAVYNVHWILSATDGEGHTASTYGTQALGAIDPANFTAFESLTKEQVQGWIEAEWGAERLAAAHAALDAQIEREINPPSLALAAPWSGVPAGV